MRRLKKKIFLGFSGGVVILLTALRLVFPSVTGSLALEATSVPDGTGAFRPSLDHAAAHMGEEDSLSAGHLFGDVPPYHPIYSVHSYEDCFPDLQDTQIVAARQWGVSPVRDRREAEARKSELVYVGANPYFSIDSRMKSSRKVKAPPASSSIFSDVSDTPMRCSTSS